MIRPSLVNWLFRKVVAPCLLLVVPGALLLQAQSIDSLQKVLQMARMDTHRVRVLLDLGYAYWLSGDDSLAIHYCSESVWLAKKLGFGQGEGKARLRLVRIEADRLTDLNSAYAQLDTTLMLATKLPDRHLEAETYFRKAQILEDNLTRQQEIMPLLDKAGAIFTALGDKAWQGMVYAEKGVIIGRSGQYSLAVSNYLKARQLQEEAKDLAGLRSTLPNLGVVYAALGMYKEALAVFAEADVVAKKRNDRVLEAFLHTQRADIFEKEGKYDASLAALNKALAIYQETKSTYGVPKTYSRMGRVYIKRMEFSKALEYTQLGDKLFRDVIDSEEFLDHLVQVNYAKIYLAQKQYNQAIAYATKGLAWAEESEPPLLSEMADYNGILSKAYESTGKLDKALFHYKKYKAGSDSILNKESLQKATASALNYAFDKQRQQARLNLQLLENDKLTLSRNYLLVVAILALLLAGIIFWSNRKLTGKNRELTTKNREIEEALFRGQHLERKRVASELHDNLNTKLAALRWRMEAWDVSVYPERDQAMHASVIQMLEDVYSDVRLISHNLLPTELQTQGLASALQKLTDKLNYNPAIRFNLDINESEQRPDSKVEFELYNVVLELINNVIKHSQASQVVLKLAHQTKRILLSVSDNGVGFSTGPATKGIGLQNILARVQTLDGTCHIESAPGLGTTIEIEVPV